MAVIQKLCKEIYDKIREEKLYPEDIIKTVEGLKPSEEFVNFVSNHSGIEARSATDLSRTGYVDLFPPA